MAVLPIQSLTGRNSLLLEVSSGPHLEGSTILRFLPTTMSSQNLEEGLEKLTVVIWKETQLIGSFKAMIMWTSPDSILWPN
jgi:hypothetical protein